MRKLFKYTCILAVCLLAVGKMNAQPASWTCNEHDFSKQMTVFATLSIDGAAVSGLSGFVLSAWKDGECRGVSDLWGTDEGLPAGKQVLHLIVRSNNDGETGIIYKAYNTVDHKYYSATETLTFADNGQQGTVGTPTSIALQQGILGDVNDDGEVDLEDAQLIFDWYLGNAYDHFNEAVADFDESGEVDLDDAQAIFDNYMNQ